MLIVATCKGNEFNPSFVDQGSRGLFRKYKIKLIFAKKTGLADWAGGESPCGSQMRLGRLQALQAAPLQVFQSEDGAESAGRVHRDLSLTGDQLCNALINLPSIWPVTGRP